MKKLFLLFAAGLALLASCQKINDLETKVDQNASDIKTLKEQVAALQNIVNSGYVITGTEEISGGYVFTLSNGKKITVMNGKDGKDGKDGDSFFGSVIVDREAGIVKIVLTDGTTFNIPLAVRKGIVEQVNQLFFIPEYDDLGVTFNYFDETRYENIKLNIGILPFSASELVANNLDSVVFFAGAYELKTRTPSGVQLECKVKFNEDNQAFEVEVDPKNFIDDYGFEAGFGISIALIDNTHQVIMDVVPVYKNCTALEYGGAKYQTVELPDGKRWMAEPLRYIPDGATVSDDPSDESAKIFFPYTYSSIQRDTTVKSGKTTIKVTGVPEAKKDDGSIAKLGLLYTYEAIFGQEITAENYMMFEGAKGICPEGWHIPSRDDWFGLIGNSLKCYGEGSAPADDPSAAFYNKNYKGAKVASFNEAGFNFVLGGAASVSTARTYGTLPISDQNSTVEAWYGMPSLTYLASSTASPTFPNFMAVGTTFTSSAYPEGRVSIMQAKAATGLQVRCVKD